MFELKNFKNKKIQEYLSEKQSIGDNDYSQLQEFLYSLVSVFESDADGVPLYELIQNDWSLFLSKDVCREVIDDVINSDREVFNKSGIKDAETTVSYQRNILDCVEVWKDLKDDIKNHHRFTTSLKKLEDAGWEALLDNKIALNPDTIYYRARIHYKKEEAFREEQMGAPKGGDCPSGRANPEGIPYLYLCEDVKTTFYETKVNKHDEVTVGEFKMKSTDPLYVEDLTDIDLNEVDLLDEDVVTLAKRKLLIRALSTDMSKPMRRVDSSIEYVPTQFICEYVSLTQQVSGIRFSSSLHQSGTNLVIFNPELMDCIRVKDYKITDLDIDGSVI